MDRFVLATLILSGVFQVAEAQEKEPTAKEEGVKQEVFYSKDKTNDAYEAEKDPPTVTNKGIITQQQEPLKIPDKSTYKENVAGKGALSEQSGSPEKPNTSVIQKSQPNQQAKPSTIGKPKSGGNQDTASKVQDVLNAMGVGSDPGVQQQLEEMLKAEERLKELGQTNQGAKKPDTNTGKSTPEVNTPIYRPKPAEPVNPNNSVPPGNSKVTLEEKSGYKDKWYYELTSAVAINVFKSMLDRGVPPAPEAKPISTRSKGPPHRVKDEIVVVSADLAEAENLQQLLLSAHNLTLKRRETLANIGIVTSVYQVPSTASVPDIIVLLRQEHAGVWIDENNIYRFMDGAIFYPKQKIQWPTREASYCARNLKVGLVDTGVDLTHPALVGQDVVTRQFAIPGAEVIPEDHGTALAIMLAGSPVYPEYAGLLPNATLYVAEAFNSGAKRGSSYSTSENVVNALDWLVGEDVRIINLSFGGPRNLVVELVVHKLLHLGFSIIAAAGNGGIDGPPMYPAAQNGVVAVTAIDQRNSLYRSATRGAYVDFAAPGVDIWTASVVDDTAELRGRYKSGTSYAAPFVTSIVAVLNSNGRNAYQFLTDNAIDLGASGRDLEFGWGLVQVPFTCP